MNKILFILQFAFIVNYSNAQMKIMNERIKCYHVENSNGILLPSINKGVVRKDLENYPYLFNFLITYKDITYNQTGKLISEINDDYKYSYIYNENGSLYLKISERMKDPIKKDTTVYKYNDKDSISFTYQLPVLEENTYYFDENNLIIPYTKYDYKNEKHSRKEVSRIISEEYEYSYKTGRLSKTTEGVFELTNHKNIGNMLNKFSEILYSYYPNGFLKSKSSANELFISNEEWNEDGTKKFINLYPKGNSPQYISAYTYQNGNIIKIESMTFPYRNYPTGIKTENSIIEIEYDYNDLVSKISYKNMMNSNNIICNFKYKYNTHNHWIEKVIYVNNIPKFIEKREITYFNN